MLPSLCIALAASLLARSTPSHREYWFKSHIELLLFHLEFSVLAHCSTYGLPTHLEIFTNLPHAVCPALIGLSHRLVPFFISINVITLVVFQAPFSAV